MNMKCLITAIYRIFFVGLLSWVFTDLEAQYSITLIRPNDIAFKTADFWNCIIQNNSNQSIPAYLYGTVLEIKKGKLFEVRSGHFTLAPGTTQFNTANYEALKNETVLFSDKVFEEHIIRTNYIPNGNYTICLSLIDHTTNKQLATHCLNFEVNRVTPPQLISPADRAEICEQNPFFIWIPYRGEQSTTNLSYKIHIVEILKQQKPHSAIRTNPCWYCSDFINAPPHQFPFQALPFKDEMSYAWYVAVLDGKKEISRSEVWQFVWKKCNPDEDISEKEDSEEEDEKLNKKKPGINYFSLSKFSNNEIVFQKSKFLNFFISNNNKKIKAKYRIYDQKDQIKISNEIDLTIGFNFFNLDTTTWNLQSNQKYRLEVMNPDGEINFLDFIHLPL